jgi:hypothetical protein
MDLVANASQVLTKVPTTASAADLRTACYQAILGEYNPIGVTEHLAVIELARRGAQIIHDGARLDAVEQQCDEALALVLAPNRDVGREPDPLSQSVISEAARLQGMSRALNQNSSAFFRCLQQLREMQQARRSGQPSQYGPDARFASEEQCIAYLARRFRLGHQVCRRCGEAGDGSWIGVRKCWECVRCHTQTCIRYGTVMARSALRLTTWFHAIRVLLFCPQIKPSELASAIGVRRLPTVRSMAAKIRDALVADNASAKLAGLDAIYLPLT